jgi:hypothetical protein
VGNILYNKALKALPSNVGFDASQHTTIDDLIYIIQHELDLMNEEPEQYDYLSKSEFHKLKRKCSNFIQKYK